VKKSSTRTSSPPSGGGGPKGDTGGGGLPQHSLRRNFDPLKNTPSNSEVEPGAMRVQGPPGKILMHPPRYTMGADKSVCPTEEVIMWKVNICLFLLPFFFKIGCLHNRPHPPPQGGCTFFSRGYIMCRGNPLIISDAQL